MRRREAAHAQGKGDGEEALHSDGDRDPTGQELGGVAGAVHHLTTGRQTRYSGQQTRARARAGCIYSRFCQLGKDLAICYWMVENI